MELTEILLDLKSPHWWFGVVFVGIFASIAGHYFVRIIDNRRKRRKIYNNAKYKEDLDLLLRDTRQEKIIWENEIRTQLKAIEYLIHAVFLFLLFMICGLLMVKMGWLALIAGFLFPYVGLHIITTLVQLKDQKGY